ncbi:hypothetical protein PhCBS80983_g01600 [Powellomyces hirtus]|uniref:Cytochrome c oxidase polypeptide VIIA n=1 Tax=Powellomyces hirtus TaxID=109895 RepID=A0A507ECG8_9FUNG|nr:hypothetical protein PhCBS80983_g01600 [Powellomyces hirtus]
MAYAASAVAPITGRFTRRVLFDLVGSISLGTGIAYYYWYRSHLPQMEEYKKYDQKVREELLAEHGTWAVDEPNQIENFV